MSVQGVGNLSTLLKRLEAATSRLEDLAAVQPQATATGSGAVAGTAAAAGAGAAATGAGAAAAPAQEIPPAVEAWDEEVAPKLKAFVDLSTKLGGNVAAQAQEVSTAFTGVRTLVNCAGQSKKPAGSPSAPSPIFLKLIEPIQASLMAATELKDKNRADKTFFNHLSAVSEGLPAVGWVTVEPKPGPYIEEMKNAGQFYFNRVIKDHKEGDKTHVEWCRAFTATLDEMKSYVMKFHTTGLAWNPKGGDAASFSATSAPSAAATAAPAPAAGGPPPPPPPPPPPAPVADAGGSAEAGGMDAVFSQLNRGEAITSGLRKVDKSEMTHKNPSLRTAAAAAAPSPIASSKPTPPKPGSKPGAAKPKKPAKTALEGNKWTVEYHEGQRDIVIADTALSHTVNLFNCKDSVVQIKGKVNAVQMVSCTKTSILLDTLVSSLEITQSPSFTIQVTGSVPTILIDSCDSGQLYLSPSTLNAEIISAKSSAINVSVPKGGASADPNDVEYVEMALPEQLRHTIAKDGAKITSDVVAHSG